MQRSESFAPSSRPIPLALILMAAVAIHLPLLLMKLPLKSYDTNFHIFFASHYVHHWFDPWNPKWYAGFSQMTYPPLTQQWVAMVSHVFGLDMAYMAVQFVAILLLAVGVYRFSVLWVSPRAASFAMRFGPGSHAATGPQRRPPGASSPRSARWPHRPREERLP